MLPLVIKMNAKYFRRTMFEVQAKIFLDQFFFVQCFFKKFEKTLNKSWHFLKFHTTLDFEIKMERMPCANVFQLFLMKNENK